MNRITLKFCPLCSAAQVEPALTCMDHYVSGETFRLFRCRECGFVFTQDFPDETEIGRYYDTPDYISHSDSRRGVVNTLYHWVRAVRLGQKARLLERELHRKRGTLLDIGTGTGYFPHFMKLRGWRVEAMEKDARSRAFARARFGLEVRPDDAWDKWAEGQFDVVTLWHVMEHLQHLDEAWTRISHLTAMDGLLVVAVPNRLSWDARRYGAHWAAWDVPRHLWHFAPQDMERLARKHGWRVDAVLPMPLDAYYVSIMSERYRHAKWPVAKGMLAGLRAALCTVGKPEGSSSLTYVMRRGDGNVG